METRKKIIWWLLPLLIIGLEIGGYSFFNSGLTVAWKLIGNPAKKVSSIIGFNGYKLFVNTDSGEIYSLIYNVQYSMNYNETIPFPVQWVEEKNNSIDLPPIYQSSYIPFKSPPLPFTAKQIYQFEFPELEGSNVTKFALSDDGNLWYWGYGASVYPGLFFYFFLLVEVLAYTLALISGFIIFLIKRIRRNNK